MIVLDANVLSEPTRPRPSPAVMAWLNAQRAETLYLASHTVAEVLFGVDVLPDGKKKADLSASYDALLRSFLNRVLPYTLDAARLWAQFAAQGRCQGHPLSVADGIIAATAAHSGFAVATRNVSHFAHTGVKVINPWEYNGSPVRN